MDMCALWGPEGQGPEGPEGPWHPEFLHRKPWGGAPAHFGDERIHRPGDKVIRVRGGRKYGAGGEEMSRESARWDIIFLCRMSVYANLLGPRE